MIPFDRHRRRLLPITNIRPLLPTSRHQSDSPPPVTPTVESVDFTMRYNDSIGIGAGGQTLRSMAISADVVGTAEQFEIQTAIVDHIALTLTGDWSASSFVTATSSGTVGTFSDVVVNLDGTNTANEGAVGRGNIIGLKVRVRAVVGEDVSDWLESDAIDACWDVATSLSINWTTGAITFTPPVGAVGSRLGTALSGPFTAFASGDLVTTSGLKYLVGYNATTATGPAYGTESGDTDVHFVSGINMQVPAAPGNPSVPEFDPANGVNVTWTASAARLDHEEIHFFQGAESGNQTPATSPATITPLELATFNAGELTLRIVARNIIGDTFSDNQTVTLLDPAAVSGLTATPGGGDIVYDWDNAAASVSQWVVTYRKKKLAGDDAFGALGTVTASNITLSAPAAGRYDAHIVPQNFRGSGTAGDVESATAVPNTTTGLTGTQDGADVDVAWDLDADDLVTSWQVEGDLDGGGYNILAGASALTTNSYTHVGATPGTWTYRVTPSNILGAGTAQVSDPVVVT